MMAITLEIAAQTLFGAEAATDAEEVRHALDHLQQNFVIRFNSLVPWPLWLPTPSNLNMRRAVRRLDAVLYRFIAERRRSGQHKNDLLSLLLHAQDEDGSRMTDRQVRDEAMTLFLAGHETTALALSWTWFLLAQHADAEERLAEEVRRVLGDRLPTLDDVPCLTWTEAVALEGMRLYPPAYVIGREALEDTAIRGFQVRRRTTVLMSQWVVQRDPRFFAHPLEFRPQRWRDEAIKQLPKFAYFPFGGGPRLCVGNTFAMMELVLVLATIAQRFRFTLAPGHDVTPTATFTLRPANGIPAIIMPRQ
jgi:cytochrome P450